MRGDHPVVLILDRTTRISRIVRSTPARPFSVVDEMHLAMAPIFLGRGERLFDDLDGGPEGYECTGVVCSPSVTHIQIARVR